MFQVHHYDPRKEAKQQKGKDRKGKKSKKRNSDENGVEEHKKTTKKSKKRKHKKTGDDDDDDQHKAFKVIAPETEGPSTRVKDSAKTALVDEEAFDDLGLTTDLRSRQDDVVMEDAPDNEDEDIAADDSAADDSAAASSPSFDPTDEIQRALHMTTLPIDQAAKRWGLPDFLLHNLQQDGYEHFFPIQALVIPDVIVADRHMGTLQARDVCCAAPTGSGKTLAFVLPILHALHRFSNRRLRALVVLPGRDLAQQVHQVFVKFSKGSSLKIGLAIGQTDFAQEQQALILGNDDDNNKNNGFAYPCLPHLRHIMNPGNLKLELEDMANDILNGHNTTNNKKLPAGGISAVDVLVCTPGRLVDHLDNTPGFTLQHLQFLVLDEADRLLSQSYHGWIQRVLDSVHRGSHASVDIDDVTLNSDSFWKNIDPVTSRRQTRSDDSGISSTVCHKMQLRKLLYSATFTKDPQKLAALQLTHPKFFNAHHLRQQQQKRGASPPSSSLYRMPNGLQEQIVECTAEQKPLVLLALLLERLQAQSKQKNNDKEIILVFTSSVESTHRLTRLLQLLWQAADATSEQPPPREFSSTLSQRQRSELMQHCNDPNDKTVSILVCSDGMSRGMDLSSVRTVIHYDVPSMSKTYVHRCGRTARAGQEGTAVALLKGKGQLGQFHKLRRLVAEPERVTKATVKTSLLRGVLPLYKHCVASLKEVLAAEKSMELKPLDVDLSNWMPGGDDSDSGDDSDDSSRSSENSG